MDNFVNIGKQFLQNQMQDGQGQGNNAQGGGSIGGFNVNDIKNVIGNAQGQQGNHEHDEEDHNMINTFKQVFGGSNNNQHSGSIGQASA